MADFNISDYYDDDEFVFKPRASKAVKPVQNVFGNKPNTNSTTTASTTVNPSNGAITKSVTTQTEQVSNPYEARVTPFGEIRQNTAFENLFTNEKTNEKAVEENRAKALGLDKDGNFIRNDFFTDHPDFDVSEYLRNAVNSDESNESLIEKAYRFFDAPMDESERTVDAYKKGALDDKIQKLVDDITLYNVRNQNLEEAYKSNSMPKVRADFGNINKGYGRRTETIPAVFNQDFTPYTKPVDDNNRQSLVREQIVDALKPEYDKLRPLVEKEAYRKLAEVNRDQGRNFLLGK